MNQSTAFTTLEALAKEKKISKGSLAYKTALAAINNPGVAQICGKNSGRGRFSSSISWLNSCIYILRLAGISFTHFNDAPKGGKHGDRIIVSFEN